MLLAASSLRQITTKPKVVAAMNTSYDTINIDDLARLARETCVYRGRTQSAKKPVTALLYKLAKTRIGRLLAALFKR
jgi:hypothetical protein